MTIDWVCGLSTGVRGYGNKADRLSDVLTRAGLSLQETEYGSKKKVNSTCFCKKSLMLTLRH